MIKPRLRKCKNKACNTRFEPTEKKPFAIACCVGCEIVLAARMIDQARAKRAAKARKLAAEDRKQTRARKQDLKSRSDWLKEAQQAFNEFIRTRDAGDACMSCQNRYGSKINAGHYFSVGARPDLRFSEDNCHIQCEWCNSYLSGNIAKYRPNLLAKIGEARLSALEGPPTVCKWSVEEIQAIKTAYKAKTKALLAERADQQGAA